MNNGKASSPDRYHILRRNIIFLMLLVTIVPLTSMAVIHHHQYRVSLKSEIINPIQVLVSKTKHSFELLLGEGLSTARFIASASSFEEHPTGIYVFAFRSLNRDGVALGV